MQKRKQAQTCLTWNEKIKNMQICQKVIFSTIKDEVNFQSQKIFACMLNLGRRSTTSGLTRFLPTIDINFSCRQTSYSLAIKYKVFLTIMTFTLSNVPVLSSQCSFHGPFPTLTPVCQTGLYKKVDWNPEYFKMYCILEATSSTHVSNFPSPSIIFATWRSHILIVTVLPQVHHLFTESNAIMIITNIILSSFMRLCIMAVISPSPPTPMS